ncbi:hypothetical protein BKI49_12155 [Streptomyces sp. Tue6028]|uniref:hypothetical protein n=1 Tax=Streptomyces sp. Tue6028 TaxID=2036037 RepID=UPI000BB3DE69|nr:hypothetical protein [Streptomyces sp. Tue6028]PBC63873.1 hypothetical protein BKI49_12155 [Streptomyces sp. Tue6028]
MAADQHQRIRRAFMGAALGCVVTLLLASCSDYPVEVDTVDQLTGVSSDFAGRTVEFKGDGTFTAEGLDKAEVGAECSGIADRQQGTLSLLGSYGEVTFDGVDCEDMKLAFHGSPSSFVACFTRDMTSGGCTDEFSREKG